MFQHTRSSGQSTAWPAAQDLRRAARRHTDWWRPPTASRTARSLLLMAGLAGWAGTPYAQSFDCRQASSAIEATICSDPGLSDLDLRLAYTVQAALVADPGQRARLHAAQAAWRAGRDRDCGGLDENPRLACLGAHYGERIEALEGIDEPVHAPVLETCRKLVERYRPLADGRPRESLLDVLSTRAGSGLVLDVDGRCAAAAGRSSAPGNCNASLAHGRLDAAPVRVQECFGDGPSLDASLEATRGEAPEVAEACRAGFSFAPTFDVPVLHPGDDRCQADMCAALRTEARRLAELTQASPARVRRLQDQRLSPAQRRLFEAAVARIAAGDIPSPALAAAGDPADLLDSRPLLLPAVVDGRAWLVRIGHATVGGCEYADWTLDFEALEGSRAAPARLQVGMGRGRLLGVAVAPVR